MEFCGIDLKDLTAPIILTIVLFGTAVEMFAIICGAFLSFREKHCYSKRTKKYLSEEYESILQNVYPSWNINSAQNSIRKKELRKLCVSCNQNLNQIPLYSAGTLTKSFGENCATIRMCVSVKPSCYHENETSANTYEKAEYYIWVIFDLKPVNSEKTEMTGSFYAENYYPYPRAMDAFNSFKQRMSDKGKRKYDNNALISGGVNLDNNIIINYNGIKRWQWQKIINSKLTDEINNLYSLLKLKFRLDYENGNLQLAAWVKMTDDEMYMGHNDFPVSCSDMFSSAVQKLSDIADIIDS